MNKIKIVYVRGDHYDAFYLTCVSHMHLPDICIKGVQAMFPDLQVLPGDAVEFSLEVVEDGRYWITPPGATSVGTLIDCQDVTKRAVLLNHAQAHWLTVFTRESDGDFNMTARIV